MRAYPVAFTVDGIIDDETVSTDEFGNAVTPVSAGEEVSVIGISFIGFTTVAMYAGTDNTGLFLGSWGPGTYTWNYELDIKQGIFLDVTGTGKGTIWLA